MTKQWVPIDNVVGLSGIGISQFNTAVIINKLYIVHFYLTACVYVVLKYKTNSSKQDI